VRQVLSEKRLARLDVTVGIAGSAIADAAGEPEGKQTVIVEARGGKVGKHAAVAAAQNDGSVDGTAGRET
jgi:hypothetical protein